MGIGASIFLLALGAILTFAVTFDIAGLDISVVGVILMIAGVVGLLFTLFALNRSRSAVTEERVVRDDRRDVY
jgi:hypothetical protein